MMSCLVAPNPLQLKMNEHEILLVFSSLHPVWLHCQGQEGRECIQWSESQDATRGFELVRLLAVV